MIHLLRLPNSANALTGPETSHAPETSRREALNQNGLPYLIAAALVLLAWVGYERVFPIPVFPVDDAYIVIHNAQVLLSGTDHNYPGSSALTGTTSAVHLLLVSGLMLFLRPLAALSAALWISALLYALGLVRLARVNGACRVTAVLVAVLGVIAGGTPYQLMNGLETGLVLAAVTWTLTLLSGPKDAAPSRLLPVLCGTLPFIRPDLLPLALLFLGLQTARRWRLRRDLTDFRRGAGLDLTLAALCALPWALWYWHELGSVYPSTLNAKRFFFAEAHWPAAIKATLSAKFLVHFGATLGLLTVFALFLVTTWLGRAGITFAGIFILACYAQFPDALRHYDGRYLYPLLPFFLLGAVYALRQPQRLLRLGAAFVFALSFGQSLVNAPRCWEHIANSCAFTIQQLDGVAGWCDQHLPAKSTLLIHDAGYISCRTRFRLIDLVGLKTPSSIRDHEQLTYPSSGRNRGQAISRIALRGHPDYLVVLDGWDYGFLIVDNLKAAGWKLRLVNADYVYKVYALSPPGGSASTARSTSSGVL